MSICTEETKIAVIGRYKNFDDYISSGYDYLPKVPTHWRVLRNRQLFQFKKRIVGKFVEKYQVLSLTLNGVIPRDIESGKGKMPAEFDSYQIVKPRNLIFCLFDIDETPRTIGISSHEGMVTGAYKVAEVVKEHSPEFVYYYYLHLDEFKGLKPFYTGLRKVVRPETFLGLCIPVPPLEEQRTIAAFLDFETARIDKLIAQQQRLIELLKEKRQAVISHAVTKGLNPDAPMKDSGVEWLGEVPEHWQVAKLSYVLKLKSGDGITSEDIEPEGSYPVFGGNGVRGYTTKYNCYGDFVLIGRQGALCGNINIAKGRFYASEHAVVVHPQKQCGITFISEFLRLMDLGQYSVSAAQPGISVERINMLYIALPPYAEQVSIGEQVTEVKTKIELLMMQASKGIELLKERRTALISAAVTGKIDLRGWTLPSEVAA